MNINKTHKNISGKLTKLALLILFTTLALKSQAQLDPFQSMYYQNRYLLNPALAGANGGLMVNANYQQQWSAFPGTPKTGSITGDYSATDKVGVGLNINDDQSGIIRTTRVVGSYAYHLQLNETDNQHLNFGLSLGVNNSRVDYSKVSGDVTDAEISQYNQLKPYVDGDVGAAYTDNHLLLSATLPDLSATLLKTSDSRFNADQLLFIGAAAYKFNLQSDLNNITLEPLATYRVVKGYSNIFDAGMNLDFVNYGFNMQVIYHSNQSTSIGVGLDLKSVMLIFNYNIETGSLSNYTNGAFELGMRFHVSGK
jgi:type IX secretion system PorP/SprF family membrane protein